MKRRESRERRQQATSLGDALSEVISPLAKQRRKPIERIRLAWPTVCGIELARCTAPIAVDGSQLRIEANDTHWASVLETLNDAILKKVQGLVPSIEALDIKLAPHSGLAGQHKAAPIAVRSAPGTQDIHGCLDEFLSAWHRSERSQESRSDRQDIQD